MTLNELSPAAQAVLDAANRAYDQAATVAQGTAAALRAVADQVVPAETDVDPLKACSVDHWNLMNIMRDQRNETRHRLLTIADELEGHNAN